MQAAVPLTYLGSARESYVMVELKNGYTFNGTLTNMDSFMNVAMRTVIKTAPDKRTWKMSECFLRGSSIKYVTFKKIVKERATEYFKQQQKEKEEFKKQRAESYQESGRWVTRRGTRGGPPSQFERGGGRGRGEGRGRGRGEGAEEVGGQGRGRGRGRGDSTGERGVQRRMGPPGVGGRAGGRRGGPPMGRGGRFTEQDGEGHINKRIATQYEKNTVERREEKK